ncbi:actin cytoskeleton-regulatory complex protein PAN1 [Drosophila teissieri]|uniref:actin cytoskeleton-regulatory complex protein PAN1 n=1 Tax=Drosophila teissieri TaxID=7243 RepID=UPI001CBA306D|nr:actin cytoskeleton-regulatory complex protein PAN1 [Drosophila teissieri]
MSHQQFQHHHHQHHHIHQVQSESQLEQRSSELEPNRSRNTDRIGSSMDFRNLCQRIDVDSLKAKLPQLKLPKSLPKLRGRKIFRSSKSGSTAAGGTADRGSSKDGPAGAVQQSHLQVAGQSQQFINRTPQRISTISSLMYEGEQEEIRANLGRSQTGTYRSAGSLDDDYYAPGSGERASRPISPIKMPVAGVDGSSSPSGNVRSTLTQRLQRGYKSLSELRIKHIFAKQTTVRRDNIEVDRYVEQYERELKSEKLARERRDREIAENYDIKIKTLAGTRQNTFDDDDVEHEQFERGKMSHETDESGMEATPPLPSRRKPGIAATRFAKVRKPPLEMEEQQQQQAAGDGEAVEESPRANPPPPRPSSYKQLLSKLPHLPSLPNLSQFSRSKEETTKTGENADENTASSSKLSIRQNIKRLRKSIKRPSKIRPKAAASDSDEEDQGEEAAAAAEVQKAKDAPARSSTANLRARLSRFASTEQLQQRWRKSFKGAKEPKELETKAEGTGATGAAAAGAAGVLGGLLVGSQLEKTLAKLNEKVHQLKFFQRNASNPNATTPQQPKPNTVGHEPVEIDDDELEATYHRSDSLEDEDENGNNDDSGEDISAEEAFGQIQEEQEEDEEDHSPQAKRGHPSVSGVATAHAARQMAKLAEIQAASKSGAAAWSSESLEEIADEDYPRVLIHQDHSDAYESTLIIAVASKGSSLSPGIRSSALKSSPAAGAKTSPHPEIRISASGPQRLSYSPGNPSAPEPLTKRSPTPEFKTPAGGAKITPSEASVWLPNEHIIAGFKEQTSWPAPALYKPKSIDIFEASAGGSAAFADFDEALRNAPVLRISAGSSIDTSGEEADDSSSRVTRIRVQSPQIGNSRESLMAQEEDDEEADRDSEEEQAQKEEEAEDEERDASERPPSESPPPPPLPQRRPPPKRPATPPIYDAVPPPLPVTRPPPPPPVEAVPSVAAPLPSPVPVSRGMPQRSASMSRPAKPLVKTSSLRLTYNEQVRPGDVGKVNKLISRFEGGRPRLCPRRMHSEEYERSGQAEDEEPEMEQILELQISERRVVDSVTPTNRAVVIPQITVNNNNERPSDASDLRQEIADSRRRKKSVELALDRQNSNCSRSEYGSPLSFPSSRRSSTPTNSSPNPNPNPSSNPSSNPTNPNQNPTLSLQHQRRSRRSMTRDDDNFYSFDSDEENSYYSISPSGSSRYVVEI